MQYLLLILGALAGAAFWYYRLKSTAQAAGEIADAAGRLRGAYRRRAFRKKADGAAITAIDDPVAATTTMLVGIASLRGPTIGRASEDAIKTEMRTVMGVADPEETYIFAQWAAGHVADPNEISRKFAKLWLEKLHLSERGDVHAMAKRVAAAEGEPTPLQEEALARLKERLQLYPGR